MYILSSIENVWAFANAVKYYKKGWWMMTSNELKNMADRIKARRKECGFTQEQFSEIAGLTYGSYAKIENAFQKPALDTLIKISEHLKVSLDYLVFGTEEREEVYAYFRCQSIGDTRHLVENGEEVSTSGYFGDLLRE